MGRVFGMKLEMTVNFDFGKLADNLDNLLGNYAHRVSVSSADRAKEAIDSGKFEPLAESTREIRVKGTKHRPKTNSFKPLVHTGAFRDSIKGTKDGVEMLSYGAKHIKAHKTPPNSMIPNADVPARNFLSVAMKLASKDTSKLTKNLIKAMRNAMHLSTPIKSR